MDLHDYRKQLENDCKDLDALKAFAKEHRITHHPSIGEVKLREKIAQELVIKDSMNKPSEVTPIKETTVVKQVNKPVTKPHVDMDLVHRSMTGGHVDGMKTKAQKFAERKKDANKLIRIVVTCMNPNKKDWPGEIFSVGSAKLGTFKKYVPFGVEEGWHVPKIIYEYIKERQCSVFYSTKDKKGASIQQAKQIREFSVRVLDQLTSEELTELASRQALSGSID